jgi:hypothetical protein
MSFARCMFVAPFTALKPCSTPRGASFSAARNPRLPPQSLAARLPSRAAARPPRPSFCPARVYARAHRRAHTAGLSPTVGSLAAQPFLLSRARLCARSPSPRRLSEEVAEEEVAEPHASRRRRRQSVGLRGAGHGRSCSHCGRVTHTAVLGSLEHVPVRRLERNLTPGVARRLWSLFPGVVVPWPCRA